MLKMSQSAVATSTRIAEMTGFFMSVGLSAPRYDRLALLYPQSKRLRAYMSEYYIVVVRFCQKLVTLQEKPTYLQFIPFLDDFSLKSFQTELGTWAKSIKEEIETLKTEEQTSQLRQLMRSSESESYRRKLKTNLRVLNMCSSYDYRASWKKLRKMGTSTFFNKRPEYVEWAQQKSSCTLLCLGNLGSGKSVCLASIVDDLNLSQGSGGSPVAFFFCRHDIAESLQAHTVMASLAFQLLRRLPDLSKALDLVDGNAQHLDLSDILGMLLRVLPPEFVAYFVIDGLDECEDSQRRDILALVHYLQEKFSLLVCASFRPGSDNVSLRDAKIFPQNGTFTIPEQNPDIESFIGSELKRRVQCGLLTVGRPELILEIQDTLSRKAEGMFLWVALQMESLCAARTDEAIREALDDLPGDLPDTYSRIIKKSASVSPEYQKLIFKLILAARRPLTTEELREALSVIPGDATWDPNRIINDIHSVLGSCGSLVSVDEEMSTVELIHGSVQKFLNGDFAAWDARYLWLGPLAEAAMADIVITYLNYGVFESQLSTVVTPNIESSSMPSRIVRSVESAMAVRKAALRLLEHKNRPKPTYDLGKVLRDLQDRSTPNSPFHFHAYAKKHWSLHIWYTSPEKDSVQSLQLRLVQREIAAMRPGDARIQELFFLAAAKDYHMDYVFKSLIDLGADVAAQNTGGHSAITLAAAPGNFGFVRRLIEEGVIVNAQDAKGLTPLSWAAKNGCRSVVELLLDNGAQVDIRSRGKTPLAWAASNDLTAPVHVRRENAEVARLLIERGAAVDARDAEVEVGRCYGYTPLSLAALHGDERVARALVEKGADWAATNNIGTPALLNAIRGKNEGVLRLLMETIDPFLLEIWGERLLLSAAEEGWNEAVTALVKAGVSVKAKGLREKIIDVEYSMRRTLGLSSNSSAR